MRRSGKGSGGGLGMNKVGHRSAGKAEPKPDRVHEGYAGQLGQKQGSHTTHGGETSYRGEKMYGGKGYKGPQMISDPVSAVGVGGGRTVHMRGQQGQHGDVAGSPRPQGRDILDTT